MTERLSPVTETLNDAMNEVYGLFIKHAPCLNDDVPIDGLVADLAHAMLRIHAQGALPDQLELAQFLCSEVAAEPWDELSQPKYLADADVILAFLSSFTSTQAIAQQLDHSSIEAYKLFRKERQRREAAEAELDSLRAATRPIERGEPYEDPEFDVVARLRAAIDPDPTPFDILLAQAAEVIEQYRSDSARDGALIHAQCAPDGWRLVPYEPTQDMLDMVTSSEGYEPWTDKIMRKTYQDMLDAAPALTSTDGGVPDGVSMAIEECARIADRYREQREAIDRAPGRDCACVMIARDIRALNLAALPDPAQSQREMALERAAYEFCDKVHRGEARSKKSYAAFKAALAVPSRAPAQRADGPMLLVTHIEQLLAAVQADDPKPEILVRVGEAIREARAISAPAQSTLIDALEFYADPTRYSGPNGCIEGEPDKYQPEGLYYRLDVGRDGGGIARRALSTVTSTKAQPWQEALQQIKNICAGDRVPNWKDDWQTTHSRGRILDICDAALSHFAQQPTGGIDDRRSDQAHG